MSLASEASGASSPGTIVTRGAEIFVACGENTWLRLEKVRLEGRKAIAARDFANGARLTRGEKFGA
jgi:methionyl-tRNA formyltransferase